MRRHRSCAGQSATFIATYTVTQADLNHGSINDSATATGTPPTGPATTSPPSTATVTATELPALTITKSATPTTVSTVGATVTYHFTVTNTGNVDLTNVHVTDTQTPPAGALASGPTCQSLATPDGHVLWCVDIARRGPVGDVHRDLHGDAGRSEPRVDQRFGDRDRDPADRAGDDLAAGDGDRDGDAVAGAVDHQVGDADDGGDGGSDGDLSLHGHEHGQRGSDRRARD